MAPQGSNENQHRNGIWADAVAEAIGELEKFRRSLERRKANLSTAELVEEMCRYWRNWRSTRGAFETAIFAWAHAKDLEFRGGKTGALRAFARLALGLDPKRASEFAKLMARVLDKTVPGQAAEQIRKDGKPWLMARRLHTRDRPPVRPVGKRKVRQKSQPLKDRPIFIEKGGAAFLARAGRDAGSPCRAAVHYDDLRRLLRKEAAETKLPALERKHLNKSLTAWADIRCDDRVCNTAKCEYRKHEDWLEELGVETLYELIEDRIA